VAAVLGAKPGEITFTAGATEANNTALLGVLRARGGGRVVSRPRHPEHGSGPLSDHTKPQRHEESSRFTFGEGDGVVRPSVGEGSAIPKFVKVRANDGKWRQSHLAAPALNCRRLLSVKAQ